MHEAQEPCALLYKGTYLSGCGYFNDGCGLSLESSFEYFDERIEALTKDCVNHLVSQGFSPSDIKTTPFLHLRYDKTDCALMCTAMDNEGGVACRHGDFLASFTKK